MQTTKNVVLITGGGSGIGLETAKLFSENDNKVIICGRNFDKLKNVSASLTNVFPIKCDITSDTDLDNLVEKVKNEFGAINILINNAGASRQYMFSETADAYQKAKEEIATNYLATINITERFLAVLNNQPQSAIVNVTSLLAFAPVVPLPTYSASKAALHSYSQSLRLTLSQSSNTKVYEIMPPLVDTDFSKDTPGDRIPPSEVAKAIFDGLSKDVFEIRVGFTEVFYNMYLQSPEKALLAINGITT